jgi:excinuclease ABC subunit B
MGRQFKINAEFPPAGDQPAAISTLTQNLKNGVKHQTLWGVTGSGKTYTMANVIQNIQKPTLVIAHNKTLAAQLADEFRRFFPENEVHYFVSYYDYYQPEAYIPHSDTYIEKDSSINEEIERLRHAATHALLTRNDVIIVASVSCIYGIGSPEFYRMENFSFKVGEKINRNEFLYKLNTLQYERNDYELKRGNYRLKGETLEIMPAYSNNSVKIEFFGDTVEKITEVDWISGKILHTLEDFEVFPATHFLTPPELQKQALEEIQKDLEKQVKYFKDKGKLLEAERLEQRTRYDLEMIEQTGTCSGIENYSRYFDRRMPGEPATTLIDYFPPSTRSGQAPSKSSGQAASKSSGQAKDFLLFIDESHITVSQIGAMYEGDRSRKEKLIEFGFRLPSAFDNRPLRFPEFYKKIKQVVFTTATPGKFEIEKSSDAIVRQFIRPTGLLDPVIEIRKTKGQIDDLIAEIKKTIDKGERVLVTTLTKRMAEELADFLAAQKIKVAYIHSDVETLERLEILSKLRLGKYDVLIGINLLREGLDLPEVSLVTILDADKEGFLRSKTSLIQTMGRAARHINGRVIMYADYETDSMKAAISETIERRALQEKYNQEHGITPQSISKTLPTEKIEEEKELERIDGDFVKLPRNEKYKVLRDLKVAMQQAADNLQFERAAELRDQIVLLENKI